MKLTASFINTDLKPGRYSDGRNLYLNVSASGGKSWLFIWRAANGKQRELGLGSYTGAGTTFAVGLKDARLAADRTRALIANGIDPIEARIASRVAANISSVIFADLLADTLTALKKGWKPEADGTYSQETKWTRSLEQHAAAIMKKKVAAVTDADVIAAVEPIWTSKAQTATRLLYRIEKVMDVAIARKLHAGPNPARYAGHIEIILGKKASKKSEKGGHAALHYDKMPGFWTDLMKGNGMGTKALAFVTLTAVRTDEGRLMKWDEVDFDKALWIVPAARMKQGVEHHVPLSTQAIDLLRSIPRQAGNDHVFAGARAGKPIGATALNDRLTDPASNGGMGLAGEATVHGMRSTFSDWVGDETHFAKEDREHCLAHGLDPVEGAYRRSTAVKKRRAIMQAWADYATGVAKVTHLKAVA